ncbi:FadR/GntR family transcriptional regulator [Luedemannella helvata]|uniref:FCD domain-containing protein n=1 Tax=Luedemannella helvata TaxID=349315 RepID=A0ABP4VUT5_9ACTN
MAELVSQNLRRQIVRGELSEGDTLPSETELMAEFGVSRPTLREAFRILESEGLIYVRRGAHGGTLVKRPDGDAAARYTGLILEFQGTTLADVYDARNVIEAPCVGLLAKRRTKKDITRLREALAEAREVIEDSTRLIEYHNAFHALVIELAGNKTLTVLNHMVRHIIEESSAAHMAADAGTPANIAAIRKGFRAHELLVDHIEAQDADAAVELWRSHLHEAQAYLLGTNPTMVVDLLD